MVDQDILDHFKTETKDLLVELEEIVEELEESEGEFPVETLETFAQKIDRIMGAVQTISMLDPELNAAKSIAKLTELCKKMGYKAKENKEIKLIPLFAAFWADTIEIIDKLIDHFEENDKVESVLKQHAPAIQKRLEWLTSKVITKKNDEGEDEQLAEKATFDQSDIDDLLNDLL